MIRIIIVEDESITRQWIKKKIGELGSDYIVTGEFTNGCHALEYCKKHDVDVVITDIRMVNMDGMEFLGELYELNISPYKVILSAYDEFQYARQALKLGVHEFVLKPEVTKEGLKRILEDARRYLAEKKDVSREECRKDDVLRNIFENEKRISEKELCEIMKQNHIELDSCNLVVINMCFEKLEFPEKVRELWEIFMYEKSLTGYCFANSPQEYICIYNHRNDLLRKELAEEFYRILQIHIDEKIYVGISRKRDGFIQVYDLYRQAVQARENRYFFNKYGCQQYDDLQIDMKNATGDLYYSSNMKEFMRLIEKEEYRKADQKIDVLLNNLEHTEFLLPTYVKAICNESLTAYVHKLWKYNLTEEEQNTLRDVGLLLGENIDRFSILSCRILEARKALSEMLQKKSEVKRYSQQIQEVMNYVEEHYSEKILMEEIAEKVHLSRTYISVLFKKETGERFSDYLQRVRLEKSCIFLLNTKLSMQEIAEKTGFFDSAHFSRAFKERYKCSPIEYRKTK